MIGWCAVTAITVRSIGVFGIQFAAFATASAMVGCVTQTALHALGVLRLELPPRQLQVVVALKIHPKLRAVAEVKAQAKRRVGGDPAPVVDDLSDPVGRNADGLRKLGLRQAVTRPGTPPSAFHRV